jgi:mycothiol synthase
MAAYCGRSIGTYLLRQAEVRARELMTNAPPDARVVLYTWVDGGNQVAPHLVEQEGFTLLRYFLWMEIEMDAPPPVPTWPSDITVRTFSPGKDDRAVFDATEDAFQDEPGYEPGNFAEWSYWRFTRDNFDPSLWFLAVDGDEIAGTALCRHDVGDNGGTGWISDVGVRPRWRKKGLALALLHHAFGEFYRRGVRRCSLSVDVQNLSGAIRLYERAGMHPTRRAEIRYEKELRPGAEPRT